ncbi:hypothetical protein CCMSSC00406_0007924 [Pleurotus cornucopiae]|uniref:Uncharacterized protein n=1 Tax=Pleurotus cornucopiae TaxID=5321 RepID=A0ACB7IPF9_PLECO|nr:hypothetical protein CCMSSC00406_0007924 [Pleurotus cornucopiae]
MPPRARVLKPKKERDCNALDQLGIATGEYVYLVTKHTEGARHLPNLTEIHEQGSQQWLRIAPVMPAPGDPDYAAKRQVFFDTCDRYCKCDTPADPVELVFFPPSHDVAYSRITIMYLRSVIAVQAAGFAMQTSMAEMDALPGADKSYVYKKAKEYSFEKCRKREAELGIPYRPIPPQAIYRTAAGGTAYCTIVDYGTSRVRGEWFLISHRDSGAEEHLTKEQMFDLLDRSMDICEPEK